MKYLMFTGQIVFWTALNSLGQLQLSIDIQNRAQTIRHFGSSSAFNLQEITEGASQTQIDNMARLIFSTELDEAGNPLGLGLSSFRVEIGACSKDQGSASGIQNSSRRADCPLRPDESYDFSYMEPEIVWVDKAYEYGLAAVFGYSNSPPIYFTKNGLACRTPELEPYSNLRDDAYSDFAEYLAQVALFFKDRGTPLHYISPVNEPQWEWLCEGSNQEGNQWSTSQIRDIAVALDAALTQHDLATQISLSEGGSIDRIYGFQGDPTGDQLRFWEEGSSLYIGDLPSLASHVAGHGYWTEDTDTRLINTRRDMAQSVAETHPDLEWWQSEYSFLGSGFDDDIGGSSDINYGLFLAKVIHHDLTVGQAAAWQYWETFNGGLKYKLASTTSNGANMDKTGAALGQYSFFVRPGFVRLEVERSDGLTPAQAVDGVMPSAFLEPSSGRVVVVAVNYTSSEEEIALEMGVPEATDVQVYRTSASQSLEALQAGTVSDIYTLPAKTITTLTLQHENLVSPLRIFQSVNFPSDFLDEIKLYQGREKAVLHIPAFRTNMQVDLFDVRGHKVFSFTAVESPMRLELNSLDPGMYWLRAQANNISGLKALTLLP